MGKFLFKWALNGVIVVIFLTYYADMSYLTAILAATVLTIIAYLIGDVYILPRTGDVVAAIADAVLALAYLMVAALIFDWQLSFGEAAVIAAVLGFAEFFYHRFVLRGNISMKKVS